MKILQLAKYAPSQRGGIEKLVRQVSEYLSSTSFRVDVLCFDQKEKSRFDIYYSYTVFRARTLFTLFSTPVSLHNLYFFKKLYRSYDVFYLHLPNPFVAFYSLFIPRSPKTIVHFHAEVRTHPIYWIYRYLEAKVLSSASAIIATSSSVASSPSLKPYANKLHIVPLGLSQEDYSPVNRSEITSSIASVADNPYIIFLGRFVSYKNIDYILESFAAIQRRYPSLWLCLCGTGPLYSRIISLIRKLDLTCRVHVIDNPSDTEKRYLLSKALFSILASTTNAEAFGYTQLESMAQGTPVVSFNIPGSGVAEVNKDGYTGLTLSISDSKSKIIESLADSYIRLLNTPGLLTTLSENSIAYAQTFSPSYTVCKVKSILEEVGHE